MGCIILFPPPSSGDMNSKDDYSESFDASTSTWTADFSSAAARSMFIAFETSLQQPLQLRQLSDDLATSDLARWDEFSIESCNDDDDDDDDESFKTAEPEEQKKSDDALVFLSKSSCSTSGESRGKQDRIDFTLHNNPFQEGTTIRNNLLLWDYAALRHAYKETNRVSSHKLNDIVHELLLRAAGSPLPLIITFMKKGRHDAADDNDDEDVLSISFLTEHGGHDDEDDDHLINSLTDFSTKPSSPQRINNAAITNIDVSREKSDGSVTSW